MTNLVLGGTVACTLERRVLSGTPIESLTAFSTAGELTRPDSVSMATVTCWPLTVASGDRALPMVGCRTTVALES